MNTVIQSLWVGPRLSAMESLCISSFLKNGHPFHLYTYGPVEGVPEGTELKDASEILPASSVFTYAEYQSYAGFANFFRYKLLWERGGWWVDTDLICIKPFDFPAPFVFSSEHGSREPHINAGAIKVPPASKVMRFAWGACQSMDPKKLKWSQSGPRLLRTAVEVCFLQKYVQPPHVFCPIHFTEWEKMLNPRAAWSFDGETRAIHCWNELWRRSNQSKDVTYHYDCLYERLRRRYDPSYKNDIRSTKSLYVSSDSR